MTDTAPPSSPTDRIATLEAGLAHLKEMSAYRERILLDRIEALDARNRAQDLAAEAFAQDLTEQVKEMKKTLWGGMVWLVTAVGSMLFAAALKALGLA